MVIQRFPQHPHQHGMATTAQLRRAGFSEWNLNELAAAGHRVARGVYSAQAGPWSPSLLAVAGGLWAGAASALTGAAALAPWGLSTADVPVLRFLVPPECRTRRNALGMVTVRSRRRPTSVRRSGVVVAGVERVLADAGRFKELSAESLMAVSLIALQQGLTTPHLLAREVAEGGDAGTGGVQDAVVAFRQGAWSRPEAVLGDAVRAHPDLPRMLANPRLATSDGELIGTPDGYFSGEGVVVQVDSKQYHEGVDARGRDLSALTTARDQRYRARGLHVVTVKPVRLYEDMAGFLRELVAVVSARRGRGMPGIVVTP